MPGGAGGLGIGAVVIIGLISWYFGIDPSVLLNGAQILTGGGSHLEQTSPPPPVATGTPNDPTGNFVALVLGDTEDRWTEIFAAGGQTLSPAEAAAVHGLGADAAARIAQSAMGPFYCPRDQRIYLDTSFFDDLQNKFGGCANNNACKFSEAYVIAHEVGHHVQNELGILPRVHADAAGVGEQGRGEPAAGARRIAGRLFRRRVGESARSRSTISSIPATSIRRCRPRPPSATTGCKRSRRAMSCPTPSPTARPSSASAGS